MSEETHSGKNSSWMWIGILGLVLAAYILSPGLFVVGFRYWGWKANPTLVKSYETFYYPLASLAENSEPVGRFYVWYFAWCAGE